jgi:glyoxylase-like metal-dependent hydrolase (beta-lactamase superfamily II)
MFVETLTLGSLAENCYIVGDETTRAAVVIDPGDEAERILAVLRARNLQVKLIANTHGDVDHVMAVAPIKRITGAPFAIHPADIPLLKRAHAQYVQWFGTLAEPPPDPDLELSDGQELEVDGLKFTVLHTPGHTQGSVCFYFPEHKVLVSGDTLFRGGVGRTDRPVGNWRQLIESIRDKLLVLPDETVVYPGHGPPTTIGQEKSFNPFLRELTSG